MTNKQLTDLQERIRNGEAGLQKLKPDDPKYKLVKAKVDGLRAEQDELNKVGPVSGGSLHPSNRTDNRESSHNFVETTSYFISPPIWQDPRPDLTQDAHLWTSLLELAHEHDDELCGILNGFRCGGTRLRFGDTRWVLRPDLDPTGGVAWASQVEYDEMKAKYLTEWGGVLGAMLDELTKRFPNTLLVQQFSTTLQHTVIPI